MNFGLMIVILLYSDLRHVSATHMAIFRVPGERIQLQYIYSVSGTVHS
jgi:hypothetical protein